MKAAMILTVAASMAFCLSAEQKTFCNPISIENYPVGLFCRGIKNGDPPSREPETWLTPDKKVVQFRELADPSVLFENGVWYIYP